MPPHVLLSKSDGTETRKGKFKLKKDPAALSKPVIRPKRIVEQHGKTELALAAISASVAARGSCS